MNEETQQPDALAKTNPLPKLSEEKLEVIKRQGRNLAVSRHKGKFANVTTAAAVALAKVIRQTTHTPNENGKTEFQEIVENNNSVAKANTEPKALGAVSQWAETLDVLGGTKDARRNLQEPEAQNHSLTVNTGYVMAQMLANVISELSARLAKYEAIPEHLRIVNMDEVKNEMKKPSFASESAPFIEGEVVQQNSGQPAQHVKHERRVAQIPKPYNEFWRRRGDPR